jgi:hypothetical protein
VTTSMMTPPFSIWARPTFTVQVPFSMVLLLDDRHLQNVACLLYQDGTVMQLALTWSDLRSGRIFG